MYALAAYEDYPSIAVPLAGAPDPGGNLGDAADLVCHRVPRGAVVAAGSGPQSLQTCSGDSLVGHGFFDLRALAPSSEWRLPGPRPQGGSFLAPHRIVASELLGSTGRASLDIFGMGRYWTAPCIARDFRDSGARVSDDQEIACPCAQKH